MLAFMKCIAEGIAAVGAKGLMEIVPGGKYLHEVGAHALKRHREKKAQKKIEDEMKEVIGAKADVALAAAKQVVDEVLPQLQAREKELVKQYLASIPEAARQSLKRKDDPTGSSLPFGYTIHEPDDIVKLLPQHPPRFVPGEWVPGREDNWRLVRKLGGGGFGEVWLARHEWNDTVAAIKFCTDATARNRLTTHEKELIVRVMRYAADQPNIVPLRECHLSGETPWLMYEFVEGGTLADAMLDWHKLTAPERVSRSVALLHTLASAVGHFHALDPAIIHRDLKPANILMAGSVPRITDFGIGGTAVDYFVASESRGVRSITGRLPTMLSGSYSLLYASPQQRNGEKPDPRDDVHALGVIAYQMLTGDLSAAPGIDMADDLRDAGAPDALIALIGKSVAQKADRRPKDAREWLPALAQLAPGELPLTAPLLPKPTPAPAKPIHTIRTPGEIVEFPIGRGLKMLFCWIPPGTAQLGSPPDEQGAVIAGNKRSRWLENESAAQRGKYHTRGFWLGKYPVMQLEWDAVMDELPCFFSTRGAGAANVKSIDTTRFPVESVSWEMIRGAGEFQQNGFLQRINALPGRDSVFGASSVFTLPHDDQWEYACRGGLGNGRAFYFGNELNGTLANMQGTEPFGTDSIGPYLQRPTPVGAYEAVAPHPWGLCDMHGNVWEWCESVRSATNITHVFRGGSWCMSGIYCRSSYRFFFTPEDKDFSIGLRLCVRSQ